MRLLDRPFLKSGFFPLSHCGLTFILLAFLSLAMGCTKEGDFWTLNRRNPNDSLADTNPEDDRLPFILTLPPSAEDPSKWRAELRCEGKRKMEAIGWLYTSDGSEPIDPSADALYSDNTGLGFHAVDIPDGFCNSGVKFRAFAENRFGVHLGEVLNYDAVVTEGQVTWTTPQTTLVTTSTVHAQCALSLDDCLTLSGVGVCWGSTSNPTLADASMSLTLASGSPYEASLTGWSPSETFHLRFYATTATGTTYSDNLQVTTLPPGPPTVWTQDATGVAITEATLHGEVVDDGGNSVSSRGFYVATSSNPTSADLVINAGSGTGAFSAPASGLTPSTTYYFRAFATNVTGVGLGVIKALTTAPAPTVPSVSTTSASSIGFDQAVVNGLVTSDGDEPVSLRGFYLSTNPDPGQGDVTLTAGSGTGTFNALASTLTEGTSYFYRAFATNTIGTGLGAVQSFNTAPAPTAPAVLTLSATSVGQGSAQLQGEVANDGGSTVTARGFYLSTDGDPDAGDPTYSAGAGTGAFSSEAGSLMAGTTYQFRAFATNAQGTTQGNLHTFTTLPIPSPDPIAPINGTTVGCCYFYLDWACVDGATAYEVQMSTTPDFSGNPVGMPEAPGGMLSVGTTMTATYNANCFSGSDSTPQLGTGSGGASGQTFYWRVRAILGDSPGPWSPTASFLYTF